MRELSRPDRAGARDRPRHDRGGQRRARPARVAGEILEDVVWRHRSTKVAPKTVNQKRYVDSIRPNTITFGDRPGRHRQDLPGDGDGGRRALARREVNRIILTRPAVEAGERLGFLPGDLMAKVDPYLRPLFDALHDMIDPERVVAASRAQA